MARGAGRAGRILALVVAVAAAALGVLLVPAPTSTSAAPTQDCTVRTLVGGECPTTTETVLTTTTFEETGSTTSLADPTSTTGRQITTTSAEPTQETTTTLPAGSSADLLIPGDGTQGAESTTTTIATPLRASDAGLSDGALIALVVLGLMVVAGVAVVLTWRYWVATRGPASEWDAGSAHAG